MNTDENGNLILAGSAHIQVPDKIAFITKRGKIKAINPLTKSGAIASRNKEKVIKLTTGKGFKKINMGTTKNIQDLEKKYKSLFDEHDKESKKESDLYNKIGSGKGKKEREKEYNNQVSKVNTLYIKIQEPIKEIKKAKEYVNDKWQRFF